MRWGRQLVKNTFHAVDPWRSLPGQLWLPKGKLESPKQAVVCHLLK